MNYSERKMQRKKKYFSLHGVKKQICSACNGTGYYDMNGSPPCCACKGKGWIRESKGDT